MHIISKKGLNSAELETLTTSRSPTTVITANGEVQTHEEATVCQRIEWILDNERPGEYASSFIARKALRWTRILTRVDQRSKTTSYFKRCSDTIQYGELRSDRGSWFTNEFFLKLAFFNIHDRRLTIPRLPQARQPHHPLHPQLCQAKVWLDKCGETHSSETSEELLNKPTKTP